MSITLPDLAPGEYDGDYSSGAWSVHRTVMGEFRYRCSHVIRQTWNGATYERRCNNGCAAPDSLCGHHAGTAKPWTSKRGYRRERPRLVLSHEDAAKVWWFFTVLGGSEAFDGLREPV